MFSSLVRSGDDLNPAPEAASSWEIEGLKYRFHMVRGLRFSNGREVTKDDLEYSFAEAMSKSSPFSSPLENIEKVSAIDEDGKLTVEIKLKKASATFLSDLTTVKILPKTEILSAPDQFASQPIGTGPYRLKEMDSNTVELEAVENHAYAKVKMKKLLFKIVRDDQTRALKMLNGEIDIAQQEFPPAKIKQLRASDDLSVIESPGLSMTYILVNFHDKDLANKKLRSAIAMLVDRNSIIEHKLDGLAKPATSLLTPVNPFFSRELNPIPFDLAAAKAIVKSLKTSKLTIKTSNTPAAVENGVLIASQLRDGGLDVDSQSFEWATYYADVIAGRFQLSIMRWVGTIDPDLYRKAFHSKEAPPSGRNRGHYSNQNLDPLLEEGAREIDFAKRKALYDQIQKIVFEDLAVIPLWYDSEIAVINRRVKGFKPSPDGGYWGFTEAWKE
jgi:peptide/nickel transport system substrate-binding protein